MKTPSPLPRSTTLVSPVTSGHADARRRPRAIDATTRSRSAIGKPFLEDEAGAQEERLARRTWRGR